MKNSQIHIVFLGGGYVSVWAYRSLVSMLGREIREDKVRLTLVSPDAYHYFHGWTAESLACIIRDEHRMSSLTELMPMAKMIDGWAEKIDRANNLVFIRMKDGSALQIEYDHLLIGMGSADRSCIGGVNLFGYRVKTHDEFLRTRNSVQNLVEEASRLDPFQAAAKLSFVIGGGGFTGVELAGNLAEFVNLYKDSFPGLKHIQPRFYLIHGGPMVLESLGGQLNRMRNYAMRVLRNYGIEIRLNTRIHSIAESGVWLEDGSFIACSMAISTAGQRPVGLPGMEDIKKDHLQRLCTNQYLQITGSENIWGGGDACHVTHPVTQAACPANALWAINHGIHAGRNIARAIRQKGLKPFTYRGLGQCASLGIGKGMGEIFGFVLTGWSAWILRWIFFDYFMPSRRVMWKVVLDWLHLWLKGRRIEMPVRVRTTEKEKNSTNNQGFNPFRLPMGA